MKPHPHIEYGARLLAFIVAQPRAVAQLGGLLDSKDDVVWAHIRALKAVGHVYRSGFTETGAQIYAWQQVPFATPDAERRRVPRAPPKRAALLAAQHARMADFLFSE